MTEAAQLKLMDAENECAGAVLGAISDTVNVLAAASRVNQDCERALFWFINHAIVEFNGQTAAELVQKGKAEAVISYLATLEGGATG